MNYFGTIIQESLGDPEVFKLVKILSTRVEKVTPREKTPWLKVWTLHKVEVKASEVEAVSRAISQNIDQSHNHSWYADYKNDKLHYIIFPFKIFKIKLGDKAVYQKAKDYGIKLGIPQYQCDFGK